MTKNTTTKYPFGAWIYPNQKTFTPDEVDTWTELGLTVTLGARLGDSDEELEAFKGFLDRADELGVKLIANIDRLSYGALDRGMSEDEYEQNFIRVYNILKGHPALYGFFCGDEPSTKKSLESTVTVMKIQKRIAPELNPWINIQGSTADYDSERLGDRTFAEWLKYFKSETGVDYYTFDEYSQTINDGGVRIYFDTLKKHVEASEAAGLECWATLLSSAHDAYKVPTEYEYMWQITTAAACGVKGIVWFRLYDSKIAPNYHGSPIDEYGSKTEHYWDLLRCQRRFQAQFGEIMLKLKRKKTCLIGFRYGSFPIFSENSHDIVKEIRCFENGLVSFFEDEEGNEFCALVNTEKKQPADFRIIYDATKASFTEYRLNGKIKMPFGGTSDPGNADMGLILYPGQMILFRIDRK